MLLKILYFLFIFIIFKINCREVNETKPIVNKCCSVDSYVGYFISENDTKKKYYLHCSQTSAFNFSDIPIYDNNYKITKETLKSVFEIVPGKFDNRTFKQLSTVYTQFNFYLTKESGLVMEVPNSYERYKPIDTDNFCYDYHKKGRNEFVPKFWVHLKKDPPPNKSDRAVLLTTVMLVSSVFLLMVLIVYALLAELRNLCGLILMAYVSSLLGAFVLLATMRMGGHGDSMCVNLTCAIYFFFLAAFCWMNIMSYDIWWTFRGCAKARPIHRKGELFKFTMYSIYGYGVPLVMTVFLRVVNDVDLTHLPWFIKPGVPKLGCFITGYQKLLYLYIPMMFLILSNWIFYLLTAFNVWRLRQDTAVLDSAAAGTPAAHRSHLQRFLIYIKLSVVMGLTWELEVVSFFVPSWRKVWWLSDLYNLLIGVIIFVIFVCKPTILRKLMKLFNSQNSKNLVPSFLTRSNVSSVDNSTSQESKTMQVSVDPRGSV